MKVLLLNAGSGSLEELARTVRKRPRMTVHATRLPIRLLPDPRRVITRFFAPGEENRIRDIIERLCGIPRVEVETIVERLRRSFQPMHPDIDDRFS